MLSRNEIACVCVYVVSNKVGEGPEPHGEGSWAEQRGGLLVTQLFTVWRDQTPEREGRESIGETRVP